MRLIRIDALQLDDRGQVCGAATTFTSYQEAHLRSKWLQAGWLVDAYEEDAELTDDEAERLIGPVWPQLPIDELIACAKSPKAIAMQQLEAMLSARGRAAVVADAVDVWAESDDVCWEPAAEEWE